MSQFRHEVFQDGRCYRYRIYEDDKLLLTSGGFLLQKDAGYCGMTTAKDPELKYYLKD